MCDTSATFSCGRWVSYLPMFKISALCGYYGLHKRSEAAENIGKVTQKLCYEVNCPFSGPNSGLGTWCPSSRSDHWFLDYGTGGYIKTRACATTHINLVTMKAKMEVEWATMPMYYICNTCRKVQYPFTTPESFTFVTCSTFWWSW